MNKLIEEWIADCIEYSLYMEAMPLSEKEKKKLKRKIKELRK